MKIERNVQRSHRGSPAVEIAAAARSRFRRFGYAKTSMQEIAADCDMSVANLYRYYAGKRALGAAVVAAEQAMLFAVGDRAAASVTGDVTTRLITLFLGLIESIQHQLKSTPLLFELGLIVAREQPHHGEQLLRETENRIAAILDAGRNDAAGPSRDARAASRLILLASAPFILPWMLRTEPFGDPRPQVEPLMKCLVSGLALAPVNGAPPPSAAAHRGRAAHAIRAASFTR